MKSKLKFAMLALALAALAVPALSLAGKNTIEVDAQLKGKNEVPGPGSKGSGDIQVFLKPTQKKVCFALEIKNLDSVVAGHIDKGDAKTTGAITVTLFEDSAGLNGTGNYEGCVKSVQKSVIKKVAATPEKFYVNIHTAEYPEGAIRGQLEPTAVE